MATGSSGAEVALVLVDARKGLLTQTRRHALIAWLLGIRQMIVAVNKMDLVAFDRQAFSCICDDFTKYAGSLPGTQFYFIPVSALSGENVVHSNGQTPWYKGPPLLELLETIPAKPPYSTAFRFPIQSVVRPNQDFRGYAGQVSSGVVKVGQEVIALPSSQRTTIKDILIHTRTLQEATMSQSVILTTMNHIDLGRGDMLVSPGHIPIVSTRVTASLIWLSSTPLRKDVRYLIKHTTKILCGRVDRLNYILDVDLFTKRDGDSLQLNEIGQVEFELHAPIFCDPYEHNRATGSFIVIDSSSNETVAAAMIVEAVPVRAEEARDESIVSSHIAQRRGLTVWFTGLSGAGKTTICRAVATELLAHGLQVEVIDGDVIRKHLCNDLGFSKADRDENIRRIAFVAKLLTRNGTIVLVSAISPYRAARDESRHSIGDFMEVYVNTPLAVCELRDSKDLYKEARAGKIHGFTGVDDPYEPPLAAEIVCDTDRQSVREISSRVVVQALKYLSSATARVCPESRPTGVADNGGS